jgi:hypothetical protein
MTWIPNKIRYALLRYRYKSHRSDKVLDFDWGRELYNRVSLINAALSMRGGAAADYLEIGCASNVCFKAVPALKKIGVDPVEGGTHRMTSDDFFKTNDKLFDVIFVDGLHCFEQSRRDAQNSLRFCKSGGFVLFHDFMPLRWEEEHVPRLQGRWNGDVWKTAFELSESSGIDFRLVTVDNGVGIVKKRGLEVGYRDRFGELSAKNFDYFAEHYMDLPLADPSTALHWILGT